MNSPHRGQWRGALMFPLICVWINGWVNNRQAGDLRRHRAHYDVILMELKLFWAVYWGGVHRYIFNVYRVWVSSFFQIFVMFRYKHVCFVLVKLVSLSSYANKDFASEFTEYKWPLNWRIRGVVSISRRRVSSIDSQYIDNTVSWPSYLYHNEKPIPDKICLYSEMGPDDKIRNI